MIKKIPVTYKKSLDKNKTARNQIEIENIKRQRALESALGAIEKVFKIGETTFKSYGVAESNLI